MLNVFALSVSRNWPTEQLTNFGKLSIITCHYVYISTVTRNLL